MTPKKRYLGDSEVKKLLSTKVYIEEKIDGSQCGIAYKGGRIVIYTKNRHLFHTDKSVAFKGLWDWAWANSDKIAKIPPGHRICGEWVRVQHHINYDRLPDWFVAFDVLNDRTGELLPYKKKIRLFKKLGFTYAPLLGTGMFSKDEIYDLTQGISTFSSSDLREGVVVKSDKCDLIGKLVTQEFLDSIDEVGHWTSEAKCRFNRIDVV